jgi:lipoate-protein ligase A
MESLAILGLPVQTQSIDTQGKNKEPQPVCFEVPSNYEITVGGKKIVGSAQARKKPGILQHGTLPLHGDLRRIVQVLTFPDAVTYAEAGKRLLKRATSVEAVLGQPIPWEQAVAAFIRGFSAVLRLTFQDTSLTETEHARAEVLETEKYANPDWTKRI